MRAPTASRNVLVMKGGSSNIGGTEPGPTGLSILLSWRVFANYSAYFEIRCLILLVSYLFSLCARCCRHEDPGIARSSETPLCFARINPKAGLLSTGKH
jgi:hypothetical protein